MRVFIDTNLWAYRLNQREAAKSERARRWLAEVIAHHDALIAEAAIRRQQAALVVVNPRSAAQPF